MIPGRRILPFTFQNRDARTRRVWRSGIGWMAERSKALVSGTSLFGGEGSNPSSVTLFLYFLVETQFFSGNAHMYASEAVQMSRLAQLVERKTLNLVVVGSSPTVGVAFLQFLNSFFFARPRAKPTIWPCSRSCGAVGSA